MRLLFLTFFYLSLALYLAMSSIATAGDGNIIRLSQQGHSNTITIDQSTAAHSVLSGSLLRYQGMRPALQSGDHNAARVTVSDQSNAQVALRQGNLSGAAYNNDAIIAATALNAMAAVIQTGNGNMARLTVSGQGSFGKIRQKSDNNHANLNISGQFAQGYILQTGGAYNQGSVAVKQGSAFLMQNGSGNHTKMEVIGSPQGKLTYILNADHTTTGATPLVINHSGADITIIQTKF